MGYICLIFISFILPGISKKDSEEKTGVLSFEPTDTIKPKLFLGGFCINRGLYSLDEGIYRSQLTARIFLDNSGL